MGLYCKQCGHLLSETWNATQPEASKITKYTCTHCSEEWDADEVDREWPVTLLSRIADLEDEVQDLKDRVTALEGS